jgi:hypothetical protein
MELLLEMEFLRHLQQGSEKPLLLEMLPLELRPDLVMYHPRHLLCWGIQLE